MWWNTVEKRELELTIARKLLPHPQGIKGSMRNLLNKGLFLWSRFARMRNEAGWFQWRRGSHVFCFFFIGGGTRAVLFEQTEKCFWTTTFKNSSSRRQLFRWKIFPDNNFTIAFVAVFPILVTLFRYFSTKIPTILSIFRRVSTIGGEACPRPRHH